MSKNILIKFLLFVLTFLALCFILLSCEVIKGKKSIASDTTSVKKETTAAVDTSKGGGVKTNTTKEEFDWYKMTQLFDKNKQAPGDTKVYPTAVIYEGGKGSKESNTVDSTWFKNALSLLQAKSDSLNAKYEETEKNKKSESKGVGMWFIIFCFGGYWLVTKAIPWVFSKITSKYTFFIPKNKTS